MDATANPPYLFDLGPVEGRKMVDEVQSGEIEKPDVEIQDITIPGGPSGEVSIRILRPTAVTGALPVILYSHGAGWVFGNAHAHDRPGWAHESVSQARRARATTRSSGCRLRVA